MLAQQVRAKWMPLGGKWAFITRGPFPLRNSEDRFGLIHQTRGQPAPVQPVVAADELVDAELQIPDVYEEPGAQSAHTALPRIRGVRGALPGAITANGGSPASSLTGTRSRALIRTLCCKPQRVSIPRHGMSSCPAVSHSARYTRRQHREPPAQNTTWARSDPAPGITTRRAT